MRPVPTALTVSIQITAAAACSPATPAAVSVPVSPAAMTARMAVALESGPPMAKGTELRRATTSATTAAAISATCRPAATKGSSVGPLKISAA